MDGYERLQRLAMEQGMSDYIAIQRKLAREDLFYLLIYILGHSHANNDWVFARCEEVQREPYGYVDLWFRAGFKSSVLTFAHKIQEILNNPEITICIISYSKTMAESFVAQIKTEFESNRKLQALFPDIFWDDTRDAVKWSVKDGFSVRRKGNPKEQTLEGFGLIDSSPVGKHFRVLHYDDIVTGESVTSSDMIEKTTTAWERSLNLGSDSDIVKTRISMAGTHWHQADTYKEIVKRGFLKERKYAATVGGKWPGKSVFLPQEVLQEKYKAMGSRTFNAQMLLDPTPQDTALLQMAYIKDNFWTPDKRNLNVYLLADPANLKDSQTKKAQRKADYTVMWVLGLGSDKNYYVLDVIRDKMTKNVKINNAFDLAEKWEPIMTYWFGGAENSDVSDVLTRQREINHRFPITEVPNSISKHELINAMEGIISSRRLFLPHKVMWTDWQGNRVDLIQQFIYDEFLTYPFCTHDDMLDALSMIKHPKVDLRFPDRNGPAVRDYREAPEEKDENTWDVLNRGL